MLILPAHSPGHVPGLVDRQVPDWDKRDIAGMSTEAHATSRAKLLAQLMYSHSPSTQMSVVIESIRRLSTKKENQVGGVWSSMPR